ncbi:MAG: phage tail sheath family protein [Phenylobacterium sp.]|nr:phage tail sheath family protein [Phenylobacterium sp.]
MAEYLHPGVYIEEIERGPRPIEGVATSTAAFLGETERGPMRPRLVTSYSEYRRWFGDSFAPDKYMPQAVSGFFDNGGQRVYIARIVNNDQANPAAASFADLNDVHVEAIGPGTWGDRIFVELRASTTQAVDPNNPGVAGPIGFRLRIAYWSRLPANFQLFNPFDLPRQLPRPQVLEDFDDLTLQPASPNYWEKRLKGRSGLVKVTLNPQPGQPANVGAVAGQFLAGGVENAGAPDMADFVGDAAVPDQRTGLSALGLDEYRDIALVYAPAIVDAAIIGAIVTHCENERFRFAVVDAPANSGDVAAPELDPRTNLRETEYAAFYYPWIEIADPATGARQKVPPGGHVLGVYARSDVERGVFKAPANELVRGALDLEYNIDERTQDVLNPRGVNAIRKFPGRGIRIWGARTLSSNALWKYVSVRRLFIFLEHSIYDGTQWVVFEPNDERLWARVKDTIRLFLRTQWRNGAMMGETEDEAFQIACDRSTMTQDDILNGRLICEIGIAPVRPAEFVVFKIFQNTAEAQT